MEPNVILTTYFTSKPDPQVKRKRSTDISLKAKTWWRSLLGGARPEPPGVPRPDAFEWMEVWYNSLIKAGCNGVIFHDCLSPAFVGKWTVPQVQFRPYTPRTPRSLNDERYLCYLEWLQHNPEVERIFLLDLFDVEFMYNPFTLMNDSVYDIYCGANRGEYNDERNREKMIRAFGSALYENEIKLHAGTCGGTRTSIMRLLEHMVETFDELTAKGLLDNLNMAVYNKCVYDLFDKNRIMSGPPLNSRFKYYEKSGNFAIRHK